MENSRKTGHQTFREISTGETRPPDAALPARIKARAAELGFDLCGVARAERHPKLERLADWVASGHAGDMRYLSNSLDERLDPARVLPTVKSVISLGCVYNTEAHGSSPVVAEGHAAVARYARGEDYHAVLGARLRSLVQWLSDTVGPGLEAFSCVDNGPVQERVFAERAGLGWIGKNTCLINPQLGSWIVLCEILTNLDLEPDAPSMDQCGTCTRCLDACPTGAIVEPYAVDATKCLSYLTIESREAVDPALRPAIGTQIYGCDICQDVCPWNRRAHTSDDPAWRPREPLRSPWLLDLCRWSDAEWSALLKGSAMTRAGLRRIRRSLAYAAAHLPREDAAEALARLESQPSALHADVADAIRWARART